MKVKYRVILVFTLVILSFLSYKMSTEKFKSDIQLPKLSPNYTLKKDVFYKTNSKNEPLELDIYQPKNFSQKSPVVIFVHGGAWVFGDKISVSQDYRQYVLDDLIKNHYTVISFNFSGISNGNHLNKTLQDFADVLKWINENSEEYKLDTDNIGIWGGSSGAHIAMLAAYNQHKYINSEFPKLKYVVNFFGPSDLNELFKTDANKLLLKAFKMSYPKTYNIRKQKIQQLTGFDINTQKEEAIKKSKEFSPITYITKQTVPTLIFHGTSDSTVDISQSQMLADALEKNKVYHQYFVLDNAKHAFTNINTDEAKDVAKKTLEFIKSQTKYVQ